MNDEERIINYQFVFSLAANLESSGATKQAEKLYLDVLKEVEETYGETSPITGLVILECVDFYDRAGRDFDSMELMKKMVQVVQANSDQLTWSPCIIGLAPVAKLDQSLTSA